MTDHLLIDGYNVLHAWPELRRQMKRSVDGARDNLIETVRVIRSVDGLRITLVFDGKGDKPEVEYPGDDNGFAVLFAPAGISADALIEQIVRKAKKPERCQVISRDNLVIESIRAAGGYGYTPDDLADWVRRCEERQTRTIMNQSKSNNKLWKDSNPWDGLES
ncbi:NYN domain-containing protein [Rubellicoccus peritrichatus]|uniref:NYN domain-containing protein n=1 Tax=Rubellicoccus peritrichatus TaxID=3080537 RepID=A0AAQ3QUC9_9BACT|nr:NYN domain-containing protein [Puniceicoccus sp. CR14]WOO40338.1 NYN domain-containing protein [Puniceicoccus sp. CR14]